MTIDPTPAQDLHKQEELMKLVHKRRNARTYDFGEKNKFPAVLVAQPNPGELLQDLNKNEYALLGDYHNGIFDDESFEYVSPYTKGAHNLNASIMIILQDWSSDIELKTLNDESLRKIVDIGRDISFPTNKNLERLLNVFNCLIKDTYITNLLPFIKGSDVGSAIPSKVFTWAAKEFACPQIEIIKPKIVICAGLATFNAIRRAYKLSPAPNMHSAMDGPNPQSPFAVNDGATMVWCQAHPGGRGVGMRGGKAKVEQDWIRMKQSCSWLNCQNT